MLLGKSYRVSQCLFKAVNHHAAAVVMCINLSKTKVMSALMPGEQRQAVLPDEGPQKDDDKFKYLGSMFIAKGQDAETIEIKINFARPAIMSLAVA